MVHSGMFLWNEFLANDVEKARAFYTVLLGWQTEERQLEHGGTYLVFTRDGDPVAGMMDIRASKAPEGAPSHWFSYVAVDDVEGKCAEVEGKGGEVIHVFEVPRVGKIALIRDPDGGVLGFMTPFTDKCC